MTDIRPQISVQLRLAAHDHAQTFPNGNWRMVNERLGRLRLLAICEDCATIGMGNEMCAAYLRDEFEAAA